MCHNHELHLQLTATYERNVQEAQGAIARALERTLNSPHVFSPELLHTVQHEDTPTITRWWYSYEGRAGIYDHSTGIVWEYDMRSPAPISETSAAAFDTFRHSPFNCPSPNTCQAHDCN